MNQEDWWAKPGGPPVSIWPFGWCPDTQRDEPVEYLSISITLPLDLSTGREFTRICRTPEELWGFLRDLSLNPKETLAREFGYSGPERRRVAPKAAQNLEALNALREMGISL